MDEETKKEVDFALMQKSLEDNTEDTKEILKILRDNGGGLVGDVRVLKVSDSRQWKWLGALAVVILGTAVYVIRAGILLMAKG